MNTTKPNIGYPVEAAETIEPVPTTVTEYTAVVTFVASQRPSDPTDQQRMSLMESSLEFWNRQAEDGYRSDDGEPV